MQPYCSELFSQSGVEWTLFFWSSFLLLSCNLDERKPTLCNREAEKTRSTCWFPEWYSWWWWGRLSPHPSLGQLWAAVHSTLFWVQRPPQNLLLSLFCIQSVDPVGPAFVCPGHASPFPATPMKLAQDSSPPARIVSKAPSWPLSSALLSFSPSQSILGESLLQCTSASGDLQRHRVLLRMKPLTPGTASKPPWHSTSQLHLPFAPPLAPKQTSARPVEYMEHPQMLHSLPGKTSSF